MAHIAPLLPVTPQSQRPSSSGSQPTGSGDSFTSLFANTIDKADSTDIDDDTSQTGSTSVIDFGKEDENPDNRNHPRKTVENDPNNLHATFVPIPQGPRPSGVVPATVSQRTGVHQEDFFNTIARENKLHSGTDSRSINSQRLELWPAQSQRGIVEHESSASGQSANLTGSATGQITSMGNGYSTSHVQTSTSFSFQGITVSEHQSPPTIPAARPTVKSSPAEPLTARLQEMVNSYPIESLTVSCQKQAPQQAPDQAMEGLTEFLQAPRLKAGAAFNTASITDQTMVADAASPPAVHQTVTEKFTASITRLTTLKSAGNERSDKSVEVRTASLRHDLREQYFQARLESQTNSNSGQNQQSGQQGFDLPGQQNSSIFAATGGTDQAGSLFQINQPFPGHTVAQAQPSLQHTTAPAPGQHIFEDDIFNQITERFQVNARNQETRIQIKLNPAELGELKIDLSMKEGALRAHVVAQSGRVQEILERNMARLKEVLGTQGVEIEEILVSAKEENIADFDLLKDELPRQDTPEKKGSQNIDSDFTDTLESIVAETESGVSGVNLTA